MRIINYLIIFIIVLLINACFDMPSESSDYYSVSGQLYLKNNDDVTTIQIANIPVIIGSDTSFTDQSGKYHFERIIKGYHDIRVTMHNFMLYSTSIEVTKNITIDIVLDDIVEDYFPINQNSLWLFKYGYYSFDTAGGTRQDSGSACWKVFSRELNENQEIFNVKETLIYLKKISTAGVYTEEMDTTITEFQITQDKSNNITIGLHGIKCNRFYKSKDGVNNYIDIYYGSKITLKKNVGIYKMNISGFRSGMVYERI